MVETRLEVHSSNACFNTGLTLSSVNVLNVCQPRDTHTALARAAGSSKVTADAL